MDMQPPVLPDDFNWVKARQDCSAAKVFDVLARLARANVEAAKSTPRDGRFATPFEFYQDGQSFNVSSAQFGGRLGASFYLAGEQIVAETFQIHQATTTITADLTLNDAGECRLLVDRVELQPWQFLKRVLEPLLFPRGPR